jgi:hypothetical protein|tara:strand:- start:448 stop:711 length:264 start_codon:yes stop_codon:yes gene_type:complete
MKIILFILTYTLFFLSCSSYTNYEDFKKRPDSSETSFNNNLEECEKLGHLQASRPEGSKRAGEILIDKKRYFLGCMDRKGWIPKSSK